VALAVALVVAAGFLVIGSMAVSMLASPFDGVAVPASCGQGPTAAPSTVVAVPGHGMGTEIATNGVTSVVAVPGPGGRTAGGVALVLAGDVVVFSVPIQSRAVAAGISDGNVFLFDNAIGYFLDATTGIRLPRLFTADNYRGIYQSGGAEYVQTTFEVAAVGLRGQPLVVRSMPFGAIVDGCLLAVADHAVD
jgi:hypothetical protein